MTEARLSEGERQAARFLLDRLAEFERELSDGPESREYFGHVAPAASRLRTALTAPAKGAAWREALDIWRQAEQRHRDAVQAYNDRRGQIEAERAGGDWSGSLNWYFGQISETQRQERKLAMALYDAIAAAPSALQQAEE